MGLIAYACQPVRRNRVVRRDGTLRSGYVDDVTEVPDADRQEQAIPAVLDDEEEIPVEPSVGDDVPEGDAVEQAQVVPLDDDYE